MEIRLIEECDNLQVRALIQHSLELAGFNIKGTAYYDPYLADLYSFYKQELHGHYWVVEEKGQIVAGIGIGSFPKDGVCELQKLYIQKEYQGLGLANQLMDVALAYGAQHYSACYLETHTELAAAWHLYEKYGFKKLEQPLFNTEHSAMNCWYLKDLV